MDLLMKNIHMCRQVRNARAQITLDEDFNVPDARPDVEMIIQSKERVVLENVRAENEKVFIDGAMEAGILYMDNTKERQVHRLDMKLPFAESFPVEGLRAGENIRVRHETEDLNVSMINSRKLAVRSVLSFEASADEIYDLSAAVETQTPIRTCEKRKKLELMQLQVQNKDILRLKEEVPLPPNKPNIREVLWENVQLRGCRTKLLDGEIEVQGKLFLFVLYRAEDENQSAQWMEYSVPFEGKVSCPGCSPGLVPDIDVALSQAELTAKEDTDGELRIWHLEGILELELRLYGNETAEILEDVFSPDMELVVTSSDEIYESLIMRNESKCKAGGKIRIQPSKPRILQICSCSGSIRTDQVRIVEGGILAEGAVPVSILYITSDDAMPFAILEGVIPFSHLAEIQGLDQNCRFTLNTGLEQLSATMSDSEEIEVRAVISLNVFAVRPVKQTCILKIEEQDYDMKKLEAIPGITGYIVQGGESLWDIAKEYCLPPEQILEMNGLESPDLKKGDCLVLMKSIQR